MPQFYDQYTHPFTADFDDGEVNKQPDMVDKTGWQPFEDQINDLILSGQQLDSYFADRYPDDYEDPEDTGEVPFYKPSDEMEAYDMLKSQYNMLRDKMVAMREAERLAKEADSASPPSSPPPPDGGDTGKPKN